MVKVATPIMLGEFGAARASQGAAAAPAPPLGAQAAGQG